MSNGGRPSIRVIWGDDIGISDLSCYSDMDKLLAGIASR